MHQSIYERPATWNAHRYKREYNHELFTDMLFEEYTEFTEAKTLPNKLDGLADMFFISIGALWKLGETPYTYLYRQHQPVLKYPLEVPAYPSGLTGVVNRILELGDSTLDLLQLRGLLACLLDSINDEFICLGCTETEAELAITIVCDSNDTKLAYNLKSHDKGDLKADGFIPPNKRLQLLAEAIQDEEV